MQAHPGSTSGELAAITGLERHEVSRRLSDLNHKAKIYQSASRVCREMGTKMVTWYATGDAPKEPQGAA